MPSTAVEPFAHLRELTLMSQQGNRNTLAAHWAHACIKLVVTVGALVITHTASAEEYVLELEVANVQAGEAFLNIVLHDSALTYREADQIPFRSISVPADREPTMLRIEGVPPGQPSFMKASCELERERYA